MSGLGCLKGLGLMDIGSSGLSFASSQTLPSTRHMMNFPQSILNASTLRKASLEL